MQIKIRNELALIALLVATLIATITIFPSSVFRVVLGLPFLLFFPGYTLMAAVLPRRERIDDITRVALSFGLSIAVVPLIGLALNFTPWGVNLHSVLISIAGLTVGASAVAWYRRWRLPRPERFADGLTLRLPRLIAPDLPGRAFSIVLAATLLAAALVSVYLVASPRAQERYTEFYVAGPGGRAVDYPTQLRVGERGQVTISVINHERTTVSYRLQITINGTKNSEVGPITLIDGEKWEEITSFLPDRAGDNQKVEFLLYRDGQVYRQLYLWVNVIG